ncbi:tetratricopeptide repeat protein [Streptomyces sp. NBC_00487]|uniref:tetratricopeptide repeat-containing protein n=1 Tax=unclassified Streptomyces TaxID=2593676 RepID=UPI002DDC4516|nr:MULTISPECIES: tetratricopeptide repeat-containing protein [unclassified Streptomyces]WRY98295.1 tetratricopeptide repeat protein [Streptomyces sp. NBC_00481]
MDVQQGLAELAADLKTLQIRHGNPALREIERHAPAERPLPPSTVSEVLNGKRLPRLDLLLALVQTLLGFTDRGHEPVAPRDPRLEFWRDRWSALQLLQSSTRQTTASAEGERPSEVARPPAPDRPADASAFDEPPRTVRIFVAMPGTSMGDEARWTNIPEIRRELLDPVAALVGEAMECETQLVIEKEKTSMGTIHLSMFREAVDADVYIADLSGANPNVYLELGVRWALRDAVTVLIAQDVREVLFNASASRVISYGPMPDELKEAQRQITQAVVGGLRRPEHVDSPVREGSDYVTVPRSQYEGLATEIAGLRSQQGEDLIDAALALGGDDPTRAIELLHDAVDRNPSSLRGHFELGVALRRENRHAEAEAALRICVRLRTDHAPSWRELGTTRSKRGALQSAADAFARAVELDDSDAETWATLGGLHRRLARRDLPERFDTTELERALSSYRRASELSGNDTYPRLNEARVELLLHGVRGTDPTPVFGRFRRLEHLARFAAEDAVGTDPWPVFDLADTLLLTGREEEGLAELRKAVGLVRPHEMESVLSSVVAPLQDFLNCPQLLAPATVNAVSAAVAECLRHLPRRDQD